MSATEAAATPDEPPVLVFTPPAAPAKRRHEGPTSWAEVDVDELHCLAADIVSGAASQQEDNEKLPAAQRSVQSGFSPRTSSLRRSSTPSVAPLSDPLGLVSLSSFLQAASEADAAAAAQPRSVLRRATFSAAAGGTAAGLSGSLTNAPTTHDRLLVSGPAFDPGFYLSTVHRTTSLKALQSGLGALQSRLEEQSAALRALVRDNFGRFISSKAAIDDVHARLENVESGHSASGASSNDVLAAVKSVTEDARRAFQPLHERAQRAERIRVVLGLLDRYEACVELPGRLRAAAEAGAHGQLAAEYRRARELLAAVETDAENGEKKAGVWSLLSREVDKVAGEALARLLDLLKCEVTTTAVDALPAIAGILQLRDAGVRVHTTTGSNSDDAAHQDDPARVYIEGQARRVDSLLADQRAALADIEQSALRRNGAGTLLGAVGPTAGSRATPHHARRSTLTFFPSDAIEAVTSQEAGSAGLDRAGRTIVIQSNSLTDTRTTDDIVGGPGAAANPEDSSAHLLAPALVLLHFITEWLPEFEALVSDDVPGLANRCPIELAGGEGTAAARRLMEAADVGKALIDRLVTEFCDTAFKSLGLVAARPLERHVGAALLRELADAFSGPLPSCQGSTVEAIRRVSRRATLAALTSGHEEASRDVMLEESAAWEVLESAWSARPEGARGTDVALTMRLEVESVARELAAVWGLAHAAGVEVGGDLELERMTACALLRPLRLLCSAARGTLFSTDGEPGRRALRLAAALRAVRERALPAVRATWASTLLDSAVAEEACNACVQELEAAEDDVLNTFVAHCQAAVDRCAEELSLPPCMGSRPSSIAFGWSRTDLPEATSPRGPAQRAVHVTWMALLDVRELLPATVAWDVGQDLVLGLATCFHDLAKDGLPANVSSQALQYACIDCAVVSACAPLLLELCVAGKGNREAAVDLASNLEGIFTALRARFPGDDTKNFQRNTMYNLANQHPSYMALRGSAGGTRGPAPDGAQPSPANDKPQ